MSKIAKRNYKKIVLALSLTLAMTLGMSISVFAATGIMGQLSRQKFNSFLMNCYRDRRSLGSSSQCKAIRQLPWLPHRATQDNTWLPVAHFQLLNDTAQNCICGCRLLSPFWLL